MHTDAINYSKYVLYYMQMLALIQSKCQHQLSTIYTVAILSANVIQQYVHFTWLSVCSHSEINTHRGSKQECKTIGLGKNADNISYLLHD